MGKLLVLSLSLCFLLFSSCFAYREQPQQNECQLERLHALEPDNRKESEAGLIETWNPNNKQFRCTGVAVSRCTLQRHGLRLPFYSNAPQLIFIEKGNGVFGIIFPGCPETFEEPQQSQQGQSRRSQDRHQKVHQFREGDVIAVPTGVAFWMYNDDESPVVAVSLLDSNSLQNQLDRMPRRFYLAGNQEQEFLQYQQQQDRRQEQQDRRQGQEGRKGQQGRRGQQEEEEEEGGNIFKGFDEEFLAQAFNVDRETVRNLQGQNDEREGGIVKVKGGLSIISPPMRQQQQGRRQEEEEEEEEDEEQERQQERGRRGRGRGRGRRSQRDNGLEETICTMRLRQNIGKSTSPDIYSPQVGSVRTLNSLDFPALRWLRLSAEYGSLHKNAMFVPHYNLNANSIVYALKGRARIQVVDCSGNSVFDGELEAGQVLTVPQNFAVAAQSQSDRFEYVTFKTNDNAMIATLAGRTSVMRAMPEEVVAQAYQLRREQARQLKNNNPNSFLVAPPSESQRRAVA